MDFEYSKFQKTAEYKAIGGRKARSNFYKGMASRLNQRLKEMKNSIKEENQEKGLVLYNKMGVVALKFKELGLRLRTETKKSVVSDYNAYLAGRQAANNVSITKGVTSNKNQKLLSY